MSTGLDAITRQKVQAWISGNYDTETKTTVQHLLDDQNETELADAFYKDLGNLAPAGCAASSAWAATA